MFFKKKEDFDPNIINKIYKNSRVSRYINFLFGILLISLAYNIFVIPSKVVYGMGGIGVIVKNVYNIDPFITILVGSCCSYPYSSGPIATFSISNPFKSQ